MGLLCPAWGVQRPWALVGTPLWPGKRAPALQGGGQARGAHPRCLLCAQTPGFIRPWHRVPWAESAGSKWPGVAVAAPSLGARWAHRSPVLGPSPCHMAESSSVLTRLQRGRASPDAPQSEQTRGCGANSHQGKRRHPSAGDGPSASPSRVPVHAAARAATLRPRPAPSPLRAWFPPPAGTGTAASAPGSPRRPPPWAAKARAQRGRPGPRPVPRCAAPGPSAPRRYGGTSQPEHGWVFHPQGVKEAVGRPSRPSRSGDITEPRRGLGSCARSPPPRLPRESSEVQGSRLRARWGPRPRAPPAAASLLPPLLRWLLGDLMVWCPPQLWHQIRLERKFKNPPDRHTG